MTGRTLPTPAYAHTPGLGGELRTVADDSGRMWCDTVPERLNRHVARVNKLIAEDRRTNPDYHP